MVDFNKLREKMKQKKQAKESGGSTLNFWKPKYVDDKTRNIIMFLPNNDVNAEELPYVNIYRHEYAIGDKFFNISCRTSIGEECPICEANKKEWDSGNKKLASKRKRKDTYYAKILVISDSGNPENNGKIKLYKFGSTVFDYLYTAIFPEYEDDESIDVFNPEGGKVFRLMCKKSASNKLKVEFTGTSFVEPPKNFDINKLEFVEGEESLESYKDVIDMELESMPDEAEVEEKFYKYGVVRSAKSSTKAKEKTKLPEGDTPKKKPKSAMQKKMEAKGAKKAAQDAVDFDDDIPF